MGIIHRLPNIILVDEESNKHYFHDLIKNKTVVLNMFYSSCKIKCIPLGKLMKRVNLLLNKYIEKHDIHFISITLDPKNDTVDDLNYFKNKVWDGKCFNWHFYTGNYKDVNLLRRILGMYSPEPELDAIKSNHSGGFLIFNERLGFIKHTHAFDNPIDISRKIIQLIPQNFYHHSYKLDDLDYDSLTDEEIFENIQTMNSMFTVPFLPEKIRHKYDIYGEKQRGFQYNPINKKSSCCCKKNRL